ncbi:MAG TPA: hypothetical protein VKT25_06130 [Ktedonobacteraceae bacterium]|nr:hypothetical protein [Ktedonobacteraceae bacterium]
MTDQTPTFADLCNAILEGSLPATLSGSMYEVNALELRRFLGRFRSSQNVAFALPQISTESSDAQPWSSTSHSSVA